MTSNRKQVLDMLAEGKINAQEAERLLSALEKDGQPSTSTEVGPAGAKPKYLRVMVEANDSEYGHGPTKVDVRVPLQLLRAGVKLASLIPIQARTAVNHALKENGVDVDVGQLKPQDLEELIDHMKDLTVNVDDKNAKVRVFCE